MKTLALYAVAVFLCVAMGLLGAALGAEFFTIFAVTALCVILAILCAIVAVLGDTYD